MVIRCLVYPGAILIVAWVLFPMWSGPSRGPSFERQREEQRQIMQQRVQAAGGWALLRRDCELLVTNSSRDYFFWYPPRANVHVTRLSNSVPVANYITNIDYGPLPNALATLQPREVRFEAVTNEPTVVRIKLFGLRRSGRRDIPDYGLWVVCRAPSTNYAPDISEEPGRVIHKVADAIFEVYQ
jgi:hypothetical protein